MCVQKSTGIAIETASEKKCNVFRTCEKFKQLGLKVELPRKIESKVIVYDVLNEMTGDELMKELYEYYE